MKLQTDKGPDSSPTNVPENAPPPGLYRHYKGANYQVLGMARHSETDEWMVVYQALYGEKGFWLRPLQLWLEPVEAPASRAAVQADLPRPRFELLAPD